MAWSADPGDAIALLEHARDIARQTGHADDAFRATLNLATALTLLGRREDAIEVTRRAVTEARSDGLEVAYGNALRGNIAEALFLVGRWDEAREIIRTALEWSPAPEAFADASVTAAMLEVETSVDERAASLLGWRPLRMERSPDPQLEVPATRAAASFALWRGDIDDARRAAELGWSLVTAGRGLGAHRPDGRHLPGGPGGDRRRRASASGDLARSPAPAGELAGSPRNRRAVLRASGLPPDAASRREAEAHLATVRAFCVAHRGTRRSGALGRRSIGLGACRRAVPGRPGALARGGIRSCRQRTRARDGPPRRNRSWKPCDRSLAPGAAAPPRARDARAPGDDHAAPEDAASAEARSRRLGIERRAAGRARGDDQGQAVRAGGWIAATASSGASRPEAPIGSGSGPPGPVASAFVHAGEAQRREAAFGLSAREREVLGADRPGPDEPRDRRAPLHQPEDRRRPRRQHPVEARRVGPGRGGDGRRSPEAGPDAELGAAGARPARRGNGTRPGGGSGSRSLRRSGRRMPDHLAVVLSSISTSGASPLRPARSRRSGRRRRRAARLAAFGSSLWALPGEDHVVRFRTGRPILRIPASALNPAVVLGGPRTIGPCERLPDRSRPDPSDPSHTVSGSIDDR